MLGSNAQRVRKALTEVGSGCAAGPRVPWGQLHPVRAAEPLGPSVHPLPATSGPRCHGIQAGICAPGAELLPGKRLAPSPKGSRWLPGFYYGKQSVGENAELCGRQS